VLKGDAVECARQSDALATIITQGLDDDAHA